MGRKQKPVKIKRYKNSMGTSTAAVYKAKKIVPVVAGLAAVVLAGFLLGKPILDMLTNTDGAPVDTSSKTEVSSQVQNTPQPTVKPTVKPTAKPDKDEEIKPTQRPDTPSKNEDVPPVVVKTKVYYYADTALLSTDAGVDSAVAAAKAAGATHMVFDVKNQDGTVMYLSQNSYAQTLKSDKAVDLKNLAAKLTANGITPVARMYTFMDKMISTVERSTAVMYLGTETRWLDSSAALGGKAWANPASQIMQEYITALTDEILSMGVKEIIYAGFHTPTGYSLDKRDFGATTDQVLAAMKNLYRTLEGKISAKGGSCSMQVEYSALMTEGDYSHYIVHPYQMGADNIVVVAKSTDADMVQAVAQLKTATNAEEISSVTLWLTDIANTEETKTLGNYFVK